MCPQTIKAISWPSSVTGLFSFIFAMYRVYRKSLGKNSEEVKKAIKIFCEKNILNKNILEGTGVKELQAKNSKIVQLPIPDKNIPILCVLGNQGVGKSTLCGTMLYGKSYFEDANKQNKFVMGGGLEGVTSQVKSVIGHLFGDENKIKIKLIDTVGLNNKKDEEAIKELITELKNKYQRLHLFVMVLQGD